jgi:hypothetical protein
MSEQRTSQELYPRTIPNAAIDMAEFYGVTDGRPAVHALRIRKTALCMPNLQ